RRQLEVAIYLEEESLENVPAEVSAAAITAEAKIIAPIGCPKACIPLAAERHEVVGGRGRNRILSGAVLETAALPMSYTPDIWHRLPVTIQRLCGHNAALYH